MEMQSSYVCPGYMKYNNVNLLCILIFSKLRNKLTLIDIGQCIPIMKQEPLRMTVII